MATPLLPSRLGPSLTLIHVTRTDDLVIESITDASSPLQCFDGERLAIYCLKTDHHAKHREMAAAPA